jgi:ABC-type Mn2+/Zn2+ transport system ATPase subunit
VLADRKNQGFSAGSILVNGAPRGGAVFKRVAAYVMQFDALFETLTVREMLSYTAELRLPGGPEAMAAKAAAVDRVIRELDLRNVADTRIGGASGRGISGGQARRVTVGVELVTSPSVLFLDEPTTGLDAYSSLLLVRALRRLADTGRTILCTIHQPRSDIFTLFDTLLLMSAGRVGYFGSTTTIRPYLATLGIALPEGTNPADFVVDLTYAKDVPPPPGGKAGAAGGPPSGSSVSPEPATSDVDRLVTSWLVSDRARELTETCRRLEKRTLPGMPPPIRLAGDKHEHDTGPAMSAKARPFLSQVSILTRRAYAKGLRDSDFWYRMLTIPLLQFFFYAILFAWTRAPHGGFSRYRDWDEADDQYILLTQLIAAKRAFLFQVLTAAIITETGVLAEAYTEQRAFRREHSAGAYSAAAYHVQWAVRLMGQGVWKALLFGSIVYWFPYQFQPAFSKFAYFLANFALLSSTGSAFSLLMISFVPDPEGAGTAHNAVVSVLLQFAGFFLPACLMPPAVNIPYYISFGKFAFEGLVQNEFNDAPIGSEYNYYLRNNVDPNLSRWSNLIILAVYPLLFHCGAALFTFLWTRPQSFWTRFESRRGHAARIAKARLDQTAEVAQAEMASPEHTELTQQSATARSGEKVAKA